MTGAPFPLTATTSDATGAAVAANARVPASEAATVAASDDTKKSRLFMAPPAMIIVFAPPSIRFAPMSN
jgi:hypothetical protein